MFCLIQDTNRQPAVQQQQQGSGRLPPSLTRAPSPHLLGGSVSPQIGGGGVGGSPSPHQATPPPQHTNIACFGHFERELEYRYCFRYGVQYSGANPLAWTVLQIPDEK